MNSITLDIDWHELMAFNELVAHCLWFMFVVKCKTIDEAVNIDEFVGCEQDPVWYIELGNTMAPHATKTIPVVDMFDGIAENLPYILAYDGATIDEVKTRAAKWIEHLMSVVTIDMSGWDTARRKAKKLDKLFATLRDVITE